MSQARYASPKSGRMSFGPGTHVGAERSHWADKKCCQIDCIDGCCDFCLVSTCCIIVDSFSGKKCWHSSSNIFADYVFYAIIFGIPACTALSIYLVVYHNTFAGVFVVAAVLVVGIAGRKYHTVKLERGEGGGARNEDHAFVEAEELQHELLTRSGHHDHHHNHHHDHPVPPTVMAIGPQGDPGAIPDSREAIRMWQADLISQTISVDTAAQQRREAAAQKEHLRVLKSLHSHGHQPDSSILQPGSPTLPTQRSFRSRNRVVNHLCPPPMYPPRPALDHAPAHHHHHHSTTTTPATTALTPPREPRQMAPRRSINPETPFNEEIGFENL